MRRQLVSLTFAGLAFAAPMLGASASASDDTSVAAPPTVAVQRVSLAPALRDEAAMVLVGTALIALAAAVRRAA
jgi:hypothetical protein